MNTTSDKVCKFCDKSYKAIHSTQKFCSEKCRAEAKRIKRKRFWEKERVCIMCGKIFQTTNHSQECCSAECKKENKLIREETRDIKIRQCIICGKEFVSIRNRKTCSQKCKATVIKDRLQHCFYKQIIYKKLKQRKQTDTSVENVTPLTE